MYFSKKIELKKKTALCIFMALPHSLLFFSSGAMASDTNKSSLSLDSVTIIGQKKDLQTQTGSASLVDSEDLQKFDSTDLNDLLSDVPGIYIRNEDGFGLRPNIGIRGVTTERSAKITIMEDGVLIAPAPYSAPAAYYFPNINRMHAIEVAKGPASIEYGPHTVGGALNMVSQPIPTQKEGFINLSIGSFNTNKLSASFGNSGNIFGYNISGLRYSSDGFKELDNTTNNDLDDNTGFTRNDINAKLHWNIQTVAPQRLEIKLGYADEDSNETYLGLSDEDFIKNPNRRYAASQQDRFTSEHSQIHSLHTIDLNNGWSFATRAYYNNFDRNWNRFNGFASCIDTTSNINCLAVDSVLSNPNIFTQEIALLRGEVDSTINTQDSQLNTAQERQLDIRQNDREYGSYGIAVNPEYDFTAGDIEHTLKMGLRFHHDYVDRNETSTIFNMLQGQLSATTIAPIIQNFNRSQADALSLYIRDEFTIDDKWTINIGARYESIDYAFSNKETDTRQTRNLSIFSPGAGVFYQLNDQWGFLAGINKGVSTPSASADSDVEPEEAINYEYGFRYTHDDQFSAEVIGFYSDYANFIGRCRASDIRCDAGSEANAGEIDISGVEMNVTYEHALSNTLSIPLNFIYTYTESAFKNSFESSIPNFESVQAGDELTYRPEHQAKISAGFKHAQWELNGALKYTSKMRETPGQNAYREGDFTPSLSLIDLAFKYWINSDTELQLIAENILDAQEIVSRRPLGARPNQPRTLRAGIKYSF